MRNRRWANHFIRKYGFRKALEFANCSCSCPCVLFCWSCKDCGYGKHRSDATRIFPCDRAIEWDNVLRPKRLKIKEKIKKRLRNVG